MKIRPFRYTDEDYAAWVELSRALDPEVRLSIDVLRDEEKELKAENQVVRVLGELNAQVVASGVYWHSFASADAPYHFAFSIHPDYQEGDAPTQMHDYLQSSIEQESPITIASRVKETEVYRTRLLEKSNFEMQMRFPRSRLDVTKLDVSAYDGLMAQLVYQGIEFITLTDVMKMDANWQRNVWQMFTIIEQDIPEPESVQTTPFEKYAEYYRGKLFRPDSWAIAIDTAQEGANRYVGMCVVNIMPTRPDSLFAGITGVVPGHRRRKIATILKVCSAKYAQQHGCRYIFTDNEENNPMYDLNMQLGFEPLPAWVYYRKEIALKGNRVRPAVDASPS